MSRANTTLVQGVFLRHVYLMFSGSKRDKVILQYRRSMLLTLCRNLVNEIDTLASPEGFSFKLSLLELYVDERNVQQQLRSSQLLRSSIGTYLGRLDPSSAQSCSNRSVAEADYRRTLNPLLESIDPIALGKLETSFANSSDHTQTLIYVLAILRHFPLKILYTATGWQTDKEQMASSTRTLRDQFERNSTTARSCMWHATYIFKYTRDSRHFACHDMFSLCVATCYIWSFGQFHSSTVLTQSATVPSSSRKRPIARLDKLCKRASVEDWIKTGGEADILLTGVGILNGPDHSIRHLRDVQRTLQSQVAWRGMCNAIAHSFVQLGHGEMPTLHTEDPDR